MDEKGGPAGEARGEKNLQPEGEPLSRGLGAQMVMSRMEDASFWRRDPKDVKSTVLCQRV